MIGMALPKFYIRSSRICPGLRRRCDPFSHGPHVRVKNYSAQFYVGEGLSVLASGSIDSNEMKRAEKVPLKIPRKNGGADLCVGVFITKSRAAMEFFGADLKEQHRENFRFVIVVIAIRYPWLASFTEMPQITSCWDNHAVHTFISSQHGAVLIKGVMPAAPKIEAKNNENLKQHVPMFVCNRLGKTFFFL